MNFSEIAGWAFFGLAAVSGVIFLFVGLSFRQMLPHVPNWPRTRAKVTRSRVSSVARKPWPDVQFQYRVEGTRHTSASVVLGRWLGTQEECEALVAAHPVGTEVEIYYNPSRPYVGVLMPGGDVSQILSGAWRVPLLLAAVGATLLFGPHGGRALGG